MINVFTPHINFHPEFYKFVFTFEQKDMNLQYISDSDGQTTGVFIPIKEWNKLRKKIKLTEKEVGEIPPWHKNIVQDRLAEYKKNNGSELDFNSTMDEIENGL